MKIKSIIGLLFSLCILLACSDNAKHNSPSVNIELGGAWSITQVLLGFSSNLQTYPPNTIVWTFNTQNQTVQIQNNSSNPNDRYIFENGTYPYVLTPNSDGNLDCPQTLKVQDVQMGCCTITNGELNLSAIYLDGDYVKLVR
jgi:hypothetical protein